MAYTDSQEAELADRIRHHDRHGRPEISAKIKVQMSEGVDFEDIVGGPEDEQQLIDEVEHPPRNGPGSDTDAWRSFANLVTDWESDDINSMSRSDIITALEDENYIDSLNPEDNG